VAGWAVHGLAGAFSSDGRCGVIVTFDDGTFHNKDWRLADLSMAEFNWTKFNPGDAETLAEEIKQWVLRRARAAGVL
jgi:hypothetical protein